MSELVVDDGDGGVCGTYPCPEMIRASLLGEAVSIRGHSQGGNSFCVTLGSSAAIIQSGNG